MGACFHCGYKLFGLILCFTDCCVVLALLNYISPVGTRPVPVSALMNSIYSLVPRCGGGGGGGGGGGEKEHLVHTVCTCAYSPRNSMATSFVCVRTYTGDIINLLH